MRIKVPLDGVLDSPHGVFDLSAEQLRAVGGASRNSTAVTPIGELQTKSGVVIHNHASESAEGADFTELELSKMVADLEHELEVETNIMQSICQLKSVLIENQLTASASPRPGKKTAASEVSSKKQLVSIEKRARHTQDRLDQLESELSVARLIQSRARALIR
ncbi:hypothetical protein SARC_12097 [Sphaeroforma arctica JP610]|uniref:Uncharacterized protein n=1 Tax=Sphaeroforma arctica JP610 TaxID=667725 RepID=A0A0L0FH43_9EUKA|nr:hypothetical protein SARC_12097 [Sphaeroforma arctica JP610]KNC75378.1 hypothetical protein SARC_12097 [Sphaeroforma arctica JP610]|eukprot:XP_014149280.1 hypothetical protein SARC_12097 [Sphaeroforma arctica JP610]